MTTWCDVAFTHHRGSFQLNVALAFDREIGVLFGPSGAGKSLLLRLLAGLERPERGIFRLGGRTLVNCAQNLCVPPSQRRIGMVFQHLALFPHCTVEENVAYGIRGDQGNHAREQARSWLRRVRLEGFGHRYPSQLSGGQCQRVALARALAAEPELLLLDEPFSALDGPLRRSLRRELRHLHDETGIPVLYVTHAIEDACALGHRVFFLQEGTCTGSVRLEDLWNGNSQGKIFDALRWGNLFSGAFFLQEHKRYFSWKGGVLELPLGDGRTGSGRIFVAPYDVKVLYERVVVDDDLRANVFEGIVVESLPLGSLCRLVVETPGGMWQVEYAVGAYDIMNLKEGQKIHLAVRPGGVVALDDVRKERYQ